MRFRVTTVEQENTRKENLAQISIRERAVLEFGTSA